VKVSLSDETLADATQAADWYIDQGAWTAAVAEGAGFGLLLDQLWPMALIGTATLAAAGWLFRHRMY
jgi:lipoprotein signal peptidase